MDQPYSGQREKEGLDREESEMTHLVGERINNKNGRKKGGKNGFKND